MTRRRGKQKVRGRMTSSMRRALDEIAGTCNESGSVDITKVRGFLRLVREGGSTYVPSAGSIEQALLARGVNSGSAVFVSGWLARSLQGDQK